MFPFSYIASVSIKSEFNHFKQRFLELILSRHLNYEKFKPKAEENKISTSSYIQDFKHRFLQKTLYLQLSNKKFPPNIEERETSLLIKIKRWECLQYPFLKQDFEQLNYLSKIKLNFTQFGGNSEVVINLRYRLLWYSFFSHILLALFFIALPIYQIYIYPQDTLGAYIWIA